MKSSLKKWILAIIALFIFFLLCAFPILIFPFSYLYKSQDSPSPQLLFFSVHSFSLFSFFTFSPFPRFWWSLAYVAPHQNIHIYIIKPPSGFSLVLVTLFFCTPWWCETFDEHVMVLSSSLVFLQSKWSISSDLVLLDYLA